MDSSRWSYDSVENWYQVVDGQNSCDFCRKELQGVFFIDDEESICLSCILKNFAEAAAYIIIDSEDGLEILKAFEPEAPPLLKIGMLFNMDELFAVLQRIPEVKKLHILHYIALSLGYNSPHPISPLLREIAVNKIILADDAFLRVLLENIEADLTLPPPIDSIILRYNLALVLSFLAPYNKFVKALIKNILEIAKERKDTFVKNWFVGENGYYFPSNQFFSGKHNTYRIIQSFRVAAEVTASASTSNLFGIRQVKRVIDEIYTLKYLKNIYSLYLQNIYKKAGITPQNSLPDKNSRKNDYISIFAKILMDKTLVSIFIKELPDWVRTSFEEMLWDDRVLPLTEFMKRGKLQHPKNTEYRHYYEPKLPPESQLFHVWFSTRYYNSEAEVYLFLNELQSDLFRYYVPIPDSCKLHIKDSYKPELFVSRNMDILIQLQILRVYIQQVGIKRAKNGIKILKASIKDVRSLCSIEELYPEVKGLENLRLVMLLELVEKFLKKKKDVSKLSIEELIKSIFSFYFNPKESELFNLCQFLDYLKFSYIGKNSTDPERYYQERAAVQNVLSRLEVEKWVELSNIHRYFNGQGIMPQPFDLSGNTGDIYFNTKSKSSYGSYMDRNIICAANKGETLYRPYIKVLVFVLNTLGVVDIAYTMPVNSTFQDKSNPWLSVYDGIEEVSLTAMGAWLLCRTETYEGIKKEPSAKVILDDKRLIVTVEGKDPVVELTLTRLSRPLGSGCFIVSSDIFLQDCESLKDIKGKIKSFKTNICKNPPQVWEDFFTSLLSKVNPLKYKKEEMLLFQLDPVNKDLIFLLFTDPHLKWNIMKVENYQILIKKSSYKAVRKRLAEHGYLLPNEYSSIKM